MGLSQVLAVLDYGFKGAGAIACLVLTSIGTAHRDDACERGGQLGLFMTLSVAYSAWAVLMFLTIDFLGLVFRLCDAEKELERFKTAINCMTFFPYIYGFVTTVLVCVEFNRAVKSGCSTDLYNTALGYVIIFYIKLGIQGFFLAIGCFKCCVAITDVAENPKV
jgi:hypothetical protein